MAASSRQASWEQVFDTLLEARLRAVHTAMMGEILAYSEASQTVAVKAAVQVETADGEFEELAPLDGVPVLWPGAWAAGDRCLLVFCEESFAKWFDTGSVEPPELLRRHGLHAVCVPLVAPAGAPVQFVALANLVIDRLEAMQEQIDTHIHAGVTAGAAATGPAISALPAVPIIWPTSGVAAAKVKAR